MVVQTSAQSIRARKDPAIAKLQGLRKLKKRVEQNSIELELEKFTALDFELSIECSRVILLGDFLQRCVGFSG